MTTVHQINLSDDAYHLAAFIVGMWTGVEFSHPSVGVYSDVEGSAIYADFMSMLEKRFGENPICTSSRFAAAIKELTSQLVSR